MVAVSRDEFAEAVDEFEGDWSGANETAASLAELEVAEQEDEAELAADVEEHVEEFAEDSLGLLLPIMMLVPLLGEFNEVVRFDGVVVAVLVDDDDEGDDATLSFKLARLPARFAQAGFAEAGSCQPATCWRCACGCL